MTNKIQWVSLSILVILVLSAASLLLAAFGVGVNSLIVLFTGEGDAAAQMVTAFSFGFEGAALLLAAWFVLQKLLRREQAEALIHLPFAGWQVAAVFGLVVTSVGIGAAVALTKVAWLAWLILPVLTLIVIVPPIWILLGFGARGIELGSRWRVFGIFGLSMTLAPLVMITLEAVLLAVGIILGAVFVVVTHPELVQELTGLVSLLKIETDEEVILKSLAPYLSNPLLIAAAAGYVAVLVPLIEELFKPLAVWLFAWKLESPAQGLALGMLSGAAFALVESLNASGAGTESWAVVVSVRAGTSLLHIAASGLVGWGIASAFRERRILRLVAAYSSAVLIHGIWNACAVGVGLSALGEFIGKPEWLFNLMPAALGGMCALAVGMFFALMKFNQKVREVTIAA